MIGLEARYASGEELGRISEVVTDERSGEVTHVLVEGGEESLELPISQLVPGDIVLLSAGDMIPADLRLVSCKDLFIIQASLTGESFPVEKFDTPEEKDASVKVW